MIPHDNNTIRKKDIAAPRTNSSLYLPYIACCSSCDKTRLVLEAKNK